MIPFHSRWYHENVSIFLFSKHLWRPGDRDFKMKKKINVYYFCAWKSKFSAEMGGNDHNARKLPKIAASSLASDEGFQKYIGKLSKNQKCDFHVHSDLSSSILVQIFIPLRAIDFPFHRQHTHSQRDKQMFFLLM